MKAGVYKFEKEVFNHVSSESKDLITSLLNLTPALRPSCDEILTHPWLQKESIECLKPLSDLN